MAKPTDKDNIRRLPGAGDGPLEPEDPRVTFARRVGASIDGPCDQLIMLCCRDGYIVDIYGLNENRHNIRSVLDEALDVYDFMMQPVCTCDCEE